MTRHHIPPGFRAQIAALFELSLLHEPFWHHLAMVLRPLMWPYAVGSTLGGIVAAVIAYPLALGFVKSQRRIHEMIHHQKP